jgi:hypothetical protein
MRITDFVRECLKLLVVQRKLQLEGTIGDTTPLLEQCQDLVQDGIEFHHRLLPACRTWWGL